MKKSELRKIIREELLKELSYAFWIDSIGNPIKLAKKVKVIPNNPGTVGIYAARADADKGSLFLIKTDDLKTAKKLLQSTKNWKSNGHNTYSLK